MTVDKVDLKRSLDSYRARYGQFRVLTVPPMRYLALDGYGDPNTSALYADTVASLYSLAYAVKNISKREAGRDFVVPPLEGLWWADDMATFTVARDKSRWHWTVMIALPEWIEAGQVDAAASALAATPKAPRLGDVRVLSLDEGLAVQTLHVGPYDDEGPVLDELHRRFLPEHGYVPRGLHHEIYLGDPRRTAPERLRTILRQPVHERHTA
ncbi:GyrI-like domain-containing protein [Demequina sp. NBRC 110051]|uniref:GyrI-like domain-containing protein n=1 Tax=Demequina sp. NBRC 110051 TaxID=1570340 RepID=UPI00190EEEC6|nr:GyrI-like domain-containing protein [Demequina sp. NBRC 110051]